MLGVFLILLMLPPRFYEEKSGITGGPRICKFGVLFPPVTDGTKKLSFLSAISRSLLLLCLFLITAGSRFLFMSVGYKEFLRANKQSS